MEKREKLPAPTNQIMIDWIAHAWDEMCLKAPCVVKSFFVTGISNTNCTQEEIQKMFQDDDLRRDMDNDMELVFGSG